MSLSQLADLGVLYWKLDPSKYEKDSRLQAIRDARGYSYQARLLTPPPGNGHNRSCPGP